MCYVYFHYAINFNITHHQMYIFFLIYTNKLLYVCIIIKLLSVFFYINMLLGFIFVHLLGGHDKFLGHVELLNGALRRNFIHTSSEKDTATYNNPLSANTTIMIFSTFKISTDVQSVGIENNLFHITQIGVICTHLKLWIAVARHKKESNG